MTLARIFVLLALTVAPAMNAIAATKSGTAHKAWVTIPFVNYGNIQNWRAVDHKAILIASAANHWYKATFFTPCLDLPSALTVGFVTDPSGTLDKFSSILVDGHRCWFKTLEKVAAPRSTHEKSKK